MLEGFRRLPITRELQIVIDLGHFVGVSRHATTASLVVRPLGPLASALKVKAAKGTGVAIRMPGDEQRNSEGEMIALERAIIASGIKRGSSVEKAIWLAFDSDWRKGTDYRRISRRAINRIAIDGSMTLRLRGSCPIAATKSGYAAGCH